MRCFFKFANLLLLEKMLSFSSQFLDCYVSHLQFSQGLGQSGQNCFVRLSNIAHDYSSCRIGKCLILNSYIKSSGPYLSLRPINFYATLFLIRIEDVKY